MEGLPPGLEDLSEEERAKIMAVMACAEIDAAEDAKAASRAPPAKISSSRTSESFFDKGAELSRPLSSIPKEVESTSGSTLSLIEPSGRPRSATAAAPTALTPSPAPLSATPLSSSLADEMDLSHLSPAEREQILSVMRAAETQQLQIIPPMPLSPSPTTAVPSEQNQQQDHLEEELADNLAILSSEEREQILAVMRAAEQQGQVEHAQPTKAEAQPQLGPQQQTDDACRQCEINVFNSICVEQQTSRAVDLWKMRFSVLVHESLGDKDGLRTRRMSLESIPRPTKPEPGVTEPITSDVEPPQEELKHREVIVEDTRRKSEPREVKEKTTTRQHSMASSTFSDESSPQPDSGYATMTSASYDHELGSVFEQHAVTPLSDAQQPTTSQPSEKAADDHFTTYTSDDFDYTYGDDRRFVLDDDKENDYRFERSSHGEENVEMEETLEDEATSRWSDRKPRMWTTVFAEEEEKSDRDYSAPVDHDLHERDEEGNAFLCKEIEPPRFAHG
ncbi:unnamed protein product [Toxocara canis]|uniref:PDZ domain-containing protein n=1 Tax=Toxocara canis TaxID=6265 RepID=A0A183UH48_TOXCA|nr:unnamed protein product [Toxocara canis]